MTQAGLLWDQQGELVGFSDDYDSATSNGETPLANKVSCKVCIL